MYHPMKIVWKYSVCYQNDRFAMRDEDLPCMHNFVDDFFCGGRGLLDRAIKQLQGFSTCKNRAKVYTTFVPYNLPLENSIYKTPSMIILIIRVI